MDCLQAGIKFSHNHYNAKCKKKKKRCCSVNAMLSIKLTKGSYASLIVLCFHFIK